MIQDRIKPFDALARWSVPWWGSGSPSTYRITTWDYDAQDYTEQAGLVNPSLDVDLGGLRQAVQELRAMGYSCHRYRDQYGDYESDSAVFVERIAP